MKARDYMPAVKYGAKWYPEDIVNGEGPSWGKYWFVDGNKSVDGDVGDSWESATKTIQKAIDYASDGDTIFVKPKVPGIWDPVAYEETLIIPYTTTQLSIIGVSTASVYGSQPLVAVTSGTTPCLKIRAPGCRISNMSFSATGATGGGGICLDDNSSTKSAYGTTIDHCYFYECLASGNLVAAGGAVYWTAEGGAWQLRVLDNYFMACSAGVNLLGTSQSRPTDVLIRGNTFASWVNTQIECDVYLAGGSGAQGVVIDSNYFASVDGIGGTEAHYLNLTGCEGILSNNMFACITGEAETELSFGASTHTAAKIPTTVRMANNWGETGTAGAVDQGMIFRT